MVGVETVDEPEEYADAEEREHAGGDVFGGFGFDYSD